MIFEKLIEKHMIIRDASSFPFLDSRYMRFCFLLPEQNQKLLDALKDIIE
jgi:threonine-phosphate decarboxylase